MRRRVAASGTDEAIEVSTAPVTFPNPSLLSHLAGTAQYPGCPHRCCVRLGAYATARCARRLLPRPPSLLRARRQDGGRGHPGAPHAPELLGVAQARRREGGPLPG